MKICWDNLENLRYNFKIVKWRDKQKHSFIYMDSCKICGEPYLTLTSNISKFCSKSCSMIGKKHTDEIKKKMSENRSGKNHFMYGKKWSDKVKKNMSNAKINENNPSWKGGYHSKNIPLYDTYAHQIEYAEKVRRSPDDENILEVKCAYCGKWYIPKRSEIQHRIAGLNGYSCGENRLYCSTSCKKECPIFNMSVFPKGYKKASSREVQPELRQLVFERDNWTCQKCNNKKNLHCHHVEGIRWIPLESADIDKCITYCKTCHKEVHQIEECGYQDMQCKESKKWA